MTTVVSRHQLGLSLPSKRSCDPSMRFFVVVCFATVAISALNARSKSMTPRTINRFSLHDLKLAPLLCEIFWLLSPSLPYIVQVVIGIGVQPLRYSTWSLFEPGDISGLLFLFQYKSYICFL